MTVVQIAEAYTSQTCHQCGKVLKSNMSIAERINAHVDGVLTKMLIPLQIFLKDMQMYLP